MKNRKKLSRPCNNYDKIITKLISIYKSVRIYLNRFYFQVKRSLVCTRHNNCKYKQLCLF